MNYYRLPFDVVQISKVSKILMAMENGIPVKVQGATLNDVTVGEESQPNNSDLGEADDVETEKMDLEKILQVQLQSNCDVPNSSFQSTQSLQPTSTAQSLQYA